MIIDYATPGAMTRLRGLGLSTAAAPLAVVRSVPALVIQPDAVVSLGLPTDREAEKHLRKAMDIEAVLLSRDTRPLSEPRTPADRVVGTCRHFAVLACALLRAHAIPSRVRCGFATYFEPGLALDHWIIEYRGNDGARGGAQTWIRLDPELLGGVVLESPERLRPGQFLTGGEAWAAFRAGRLDAATCGVWGTENFGPAEISGNAVRDLAALNAVEMLPWDEWGRMTDAYAGRTGTGYDDLIDRVAAACDADCGERIAELFRHPDLTVPPSLLA